MGLLLRWLILGLISWLRLGFVSLLQFYVVLVLFSYTGGYSLCVTLAVGMLKRGFCSMMRALWRVCFAMVAPRLWRRLIAWKWLR